MTIIIPAFLIGAGISAGTAIQAAVIGLMRKRMPLYLVFSVTCVSVAGLLLSAAAYHRADSIAEAATALRWMAGCTYVALPAFVLFVGLYTGRQSTRGFAAVGLFFAVLFAVNAFSPYSLRYSTLERQPTLRFPWGEELVVYSGNATVWAVIARMALLVIFGWAVWRVIVQYRAGGRRQAILLGSYVIAQLVGILWGALFEIGMVPSFYIGPLAFLLLVLFMSISMGIDLRDQNVHIAQLVVEWRETFDSVRTPILVTDHAGAVWRANRAACELAGVTEIASRTIVSLGEDEPWQTAAQLIQHVASGRDATSAETRDALGRTWDLSVAHFNTGQDEPARFILVFWDTSSIVELQESLRRNETMAAMGTIVAGVAHEVRNPLFGISATLDAYEEELRQPVVAPCAEALRTEVARLKHLMQELLDYGKPGMLTIDKGSVGEVLRNAIQNGGARHPAVRVITSIPPSLPPLLMDGARLQQVFENLIDNAAEHSPPQGVVTIRAMICEYAGRNWIECSVQDDGPGFDAESADRAFEPFFTKRQGGTGLGLSIVHRIVEEHSGKVLAGNAPGGGAMIRVRLPVAET